AEVVVVHPGHAGSFGIDHPLRMVLTTHGRTSCLDRSDEFRGISPKRFLFPATPLTVVEMERTTRSISDLGSGVTEMRTPHPQESRANDQLERSPSRFRGLRHGRRRRQGSRASAVAVMVSMAWRTVGFSRAPRRVTGRMRRA